MVPEDLIRDVVAGDEAGDDAIACGSRPTRRPLPSSEGGEAAVDIHPALDPEVTRQEVKQFLKPGKTRKRLSQISIKSSLR